jgi:hypothetical protein
MITQSTPAELWLPTGEMVRALGVSGDSLKRWSNPANPSCFLEEGRHWRSGPFANSPRRWNFSEVQRLVTTRALQPKPTGFPAASQQAPAAPVVITPAEAQE